jgi:guanine nucleotide-binding protein subunit alpha
MSDIDIRMFDCGERWFGQKKLMHQFEDVTSILFVVDISSYDQVSLDSSANLLAKALELFDWVANSQWFCRCSIMLLLDKVGRFKEKLATCPLDRYFHDYSGGTAFTSAVDYILCRFKSMSTRDNLYIHYSGTNTHYSGTNTLRFVFAAIKDTILRDFS